MPAIDLPPVLVKIFALPEADINSVLAEIDRDQFLFHLIANSYPQELSKRSLKEFFMSLGYEKAILSIAAIYVQKTLLRTYPGQVLAEIREKLDRFYSEAKKYSEEESRALRLTTYLALVDAHYRTYYNNSKHNFLKFPIVIKTLFSKSKNTVYHFDYLYLLFLQLDQVESLENNQKYIVEGKTFINLYKTLAENVQKKMVDNFLSYAQAIDETSFFTTRIDHP